MSSLKNNKTCALLEQYLSLDESIRLLIESEKNPRDYCILTIFLNCALRLTELVNLNIEQVQEDAIQIIGKGNKVNRLNAGTPVNRHYPYICRRIT